MPSGEKLKQIFLNRLAPFGMAVGVAAVAMARLTASEAHEDTKVAAFNIENTEQAADIQSVSISQDNLSNNTLVEFKSIDQAQKSDLLYPLPHSIEEDIKLRDWVAKHLPTDKLIALSVGSEVQNEYEAGLFVKAKDTNCAAVTRIQPLGDGRLYIDNYVLARPNIISDISKHLGPAMFSGLFVHGDTDLAAALGGPSFRIVDKEIGQVTEAIAQITKNGCSQLAK